VLVVAYGSSAKLLWRCSWMAIWRLSRRIILGTTQARKLLSILNGSACLRQNLPQAGAERAYAGRSARTAFDPQQTWPPVVWLSPRSKFGAKTVLFPNAMPWRVM
ncbi:hypothetical protein AC630_36220, partial [Bradyrhizobium sp. AS23.2]